MNLIKLVLGWKHLPLAIAGVVVASLFASLVIANHTATKWHNLSDAHAATIKSQEEQLNTDAALMLNYKMVIDQQNAAVDAITKQSEADRETYVRQFAAADQRAKATDAHVQQLLQLQPANTDELSQCREARALLEQELVQ